MPYDFSQLTGHDLELVVRDLLQAEWRLRLESFKSGKDKGIDLRYAEGRGVIVQCKHYLGSGLKKLLADLTNKEAPKVHSLNPDRYVLATSIKLSPQDKDKINSILHPHLRGPADIFGQEDLNNLLQRHPRIEKQHFKLWLSSTEILQRVLHNAEHTRTAFDLNRVRSRLPLYVQNDGFPRARRILKKTNVVVISGQPGVGKTTLADMILYEHLARGFEPVKIRNNVDEALRLFKLGEKQIFYYDDFLGQTFLGERDDIFARSQDQDLLDFISAVRRSKYAKLIMTTREHLLRGAELNSERFRHAGVLDHKCVLNIGDYSLGQKAEILYNHIYFSELPIEYRVELVRDEFYLGLLNHRNFNPRLVEWLSTFKRIAHEPASKYRQLVRGILENPTEIWSHAFHSQISESARHVVLCIFVAGGSISLARLKKDWSALHSYSAHKYHRASRPGEFEDALKQLEGAFIFLRSEAAEYLNPSIKDFIAVEIARSDDLLEDLLAVASRFDQLFRLWQFAGTDVGSALKRKFEREPNALVATLRRVFGAPVLKKTRYGWSIVDTVSTRRLVTIIEIVNTLRLVELLDLLQGAMDAAIKSLGSWTFDMDDAIEALKALEAPSEELADTFLSLRDDLKKALLTNKFCRLEDLVKLEDFSDGNTSWSETDEQLLSSAFDNYIEHEFGDEAQECDSSGALQELQDQLRFMGKRFGRNFSSEMSDLQERIQEKETEEYDKRSIESGPATPRSATVATGSNELPYIRALFDGLLEP